MLVKVRGRCAVLSSTNFLAVLLPLLTALFGPLAAAAVANGSGTSITTSTTTAAGSVTPAPTVVDASSVKTKHRYAYLGCYNETTGIADSSGARALDGGINEVLPGNMTVRDCLTFCGDGSTQYKYAGLEYSRECWCAQRLSDLSTKFPDNVCNLGCDGNQTQACGGNLKLTIYMLSAAPPVARVAVSAGAAVAIMILVNIC
ncbi:hypothetical protein VTK73DRAFT_3266 [Phialemonium thermophilum]|uniref:WSC domain-containing protein n=1 Tax=Phialemonium thermophilum TaxID=223376 RepID=A0ABR3Y7L8_9PEZI